MAGPPADQTNGVGSVGVRVDRRAGQPEGRPAGGLDHQSGPPSIHRTGDQPYEQTTERQFHRRTDPPDEATAG